MYLTEDFDLGSDDWPNGCLPIGAAYFSEIKNGDLGLYHHRTIFLQRLDFEFDLLRLKMIKDLNVVSVQRRRQGTGIDFGLDPFDPQIRNTDPLTPANHPQIAKHVVFH